MHMKCTLRCLGTLSRAAVAAAALAGGLAGAARADTDRLVVTTPRYDQEYPAIDYSGPATHNRVWRMQQRLDRGELKLQWEPQGGYLRSLLQALEIDADSQVLVFSRTSLQVDRISGTTPRAIYFNDDTYVGWVQGSNLIEFTVIDANAGVVFFGLDNRPPGGVGTGPRMEREGGRCLTCHDTYSMMGGGVPRVLAMSSPVIDPADTRTYSSASDVDDRTPVAQRWGGWYVTGTSGAQKHFGNLPLREDPTSAHLRKLTHHDIRGLAGYFDTSSYLTDQSDIVALLVLEHQAFVQNMITRASYKVRSVVAREGSAAAPRSWADLDTREQQQIRVITEPLVRALFLADAAPFEDRIHGGSGYAARFSGLGPRDRQGRGLRQLDLGGRLFRYPLSYLIYSEHFNALPGYVQDYVGLRISEVLDGTDRNGIAQKISESDRAAIRQILADTKPPIAQRLRSPVTSHQPAAQPVTSRPVAAQ